MDLYSLGVTLFEILHGIKSTKWENPDFLKALKSAWNLKLSEKSKGLVAGLLEPDPKGRLTFEQFLNHPWFKNN